ncbi:PIN domain-containing protein [Streptomyces sp. NPDC006288]|uniref:PIN domain-containing protein n=1 Tax=Streptomyces sp. NPDC006288 TaxID=3156743 RepID=UPI0033AC0E24
MEAAVSSVVLAELAQGVAMTKDPAEMMARAQRLADVEAEFAAVPFDREAARRFGTLVALTVKANRNPRPRRMDLMIAATAAAQGLPLFTRNADDFKGLDQGVEVISV